jgi:hypothetical protein
MNKTNDILEVQRLGREWSALLWLENVILKSESGQQFEKELRK